MLHFYAICHGMKILALGAAAASRRLRTERPCPGNCIFASQQIKLQQGRERRNFYWTCELKIRASLLPSPSQYSTSFGRLSPPLCSNFAKAQHFSMLVKVNYENQRKLTVEISKNAEKLMNFLGNMERIWWAPGYGNKRTNIVSLKHFN